MRFLLILSTLFLSFAIHASVIYVDVDSNALFPDGTTWNRAFDNIGDAVDAAQPGDEIWVAQGNYSSSSPIECFNGLEIYCGFQGWETQRSQRDWESNACTFTQAQGNTSVSGIIYISPTQVSWESQYGIIDGARFVNWGFLNNASSLIYLWAYRETNLLMRNCTFFTMEITQNFLQIYPEDDQCDIEFENCQFSNITSNGIYCSNAHLINSNFSNCSFSSCNFNSEPDDWFFRHANLSSSEITNCSMPALGGVGSVFNNCMIRDCNFLSENSSAFSYGDLINCTVVNNVCAKRVCGQTDVTASVFWGNSSAQGFGLIGSEATVLYSVLEEEFNGSGGNNVTSNPLFVNPGSNDFSLTQCSPAVDILNIGISLFPQDLAGNPRVVNGKIDAGCYEFQGISRSVVYVDVDATGNNDGSSWVNAYNHLQDAIDATCDNSEIWVAYGTYYPNPLPGVNRFASFEIPDGVKVYGGFAGYETLRSQRNLSGIFEGGERSILSGANGTVNDVTDDAFHIITIPIGAEDVVIDGFFVRMGRANGIGTFGSGGALWMQEASVRIDNCRFETNYANSGGAIQVIGNSNLDLYNTHFNFNHALNGNGGAINSVSVANEAPSVSMNRCRVLMNQAQDGGGIYLNAGVFSISNSVFNLNNASGSGDAIAAKGFVNLQNCTLTSHDEALFVESIVTIKNSILWNNANDFAYAPFFDPADVILSYSNTSSSWAGSGVGNQSQNPLFSDSPNWDFSLTIDSPCINQGDNVSAVGGVDYVGNARIYNQTVDMGAYEFSLPCIVPNDKCINATELEVNSENTVVADMSCANLHEDFVYCGTSEARSRWYHFVMPEHRVQLYLGNSPNDEFDDRAYAIYTGSCETAEQFCGQSAILNDYPVGTDVYVKLLDWDSPSVLKLNIRPLFAEIISVAPTQQSTCVPNAPFSTYDQQLVIHHNIDPFFENMVVNGLLIPVTSSPQYLTLEDLPATGSFYSVEISIPQSSTSIVYNNVFQTPCCAPDNDECSNPTPIDPSQELISRLDCATQSPEDILSSCTQDPGRSLWYEILAPPSGAIQIECSIVELIGNFNVRFSVWDQSDGCADLIEVGCVNENPDNQNELGVIEGLNPGQYYLIMVSGWQNQRGIFSLKITEADPAVCDCPADINNDCEINTSDLLVLLSDFGCAGICQADINGDNLTNSGDLVEILQLYGATCE